MKTSVIIPCYRHDEFLGEAIESVVRQSQQPLEIIVVDDGSPIPIKPISNQPNQPPILWIRSENRGLGGARNLGVSKASGKYIAFLDADDLWETSKLEQQETFLETHHDYVGCYTMCVDKPGFFKFGPYPDYGGDRLALAKHLWGELFFPPSCVLIRKESFKQAGGFLEGLPNGEDLNTWMKLLQIGPMGFIRDPLCCYRLHANQLTTNNLKRVLGGKLARKDIIENHSLFLEECGIGRDKYWDAYRNDVLLTYFKRDFKSSRVMLADYLKDHPFDFKLYLYLFIAWFVPSAMVRAVRS
jgi:glycosyltransferase involved in cell wall biosynthesis